MLPITKIPEESIKTKTHRSQKKPRLLSTRAALVLSSLRFSFLFLFVLFLFFLVLSRSGGSNDPDAHREAVRPIFTGELYTESRLYPGALSRDGRKRD